MFNAAENFCLALQDELDKQAKNGKVQLVLLTSGGIIPGTPASSKEYSTKDVLTDQGENSAKINLFSLGTFRNVLLKQLEDEKPDINIIDNGSYIFLKDVAFKVGANHTVFQELVCLC